MKLKLADPKMRQGTQCICPRCGRSGRIEKTDGKSLFGDYIKYSIVNERFECYGCEEDQ